MLFLRETNSGNLKLLLPIWFSFQIWDISHWNFGSLLFRTRLNWYMFSFILLSVSDFRFCQVDWIEVLRKRGRNGEILSVGKIVMFTEDTASVSIYYLLLFGLDLWKCWWRAWSKSYGLMVLLAIDHSFNLTITVEVNWSHIYPKFLLWE